MPITEQLSQHRNLPFYALLCDRAYYFANHISAGLADSIASRGLKREIARLEEEGGTWAPIFYFLLILSSFEQPSNPFSSLLHQFFSVAVIESSLHFL